MSKNKNERSTLVYYFESLTAVLIFIAKSELLKDVDKNRELKNRKIYFDIFTATQSVKERTIIFYHIAFGWTVAQIDDYLSNLRTIEKDFDIYTPKTMLFLTKNASHHFNLLKEYFRIFPYSS